MTAKRAALVSVIALAAAMVLPGGWATFGCVGVMFYVWGAYVVEVGTRIRESMMLDMYEEMDRKDSEKRGVLDPDPISGIVDEDFYLWRTSWEGDDDEHPHRML